MADERTDRTGLDIVVFVAARDGIIVVASRLVIPGGDEIGAGQPAVEVNIGAALRAEGFEFLDRRLAADWALLTGGIRRPTGWTG